MTKLSSCMKVFALLFLAGAAVPLLAQKLTTLHSFENSDSYFPYAGVIQGTNGDFFGAGSDGGSAGGGSIFKMTVKGALTPIYSFPAGSNPARDLVQRR